MRSLAQRTKRFAAFSLAILAIALILAATASAASYNWTGASTSSKVWSDNTVAPNNWSSTPNLPLATDDIVFTNTAAAPASGTVTNIVDAGLASVNSLWYSQADPGSPSPPTTAINVHTTQINSGVTLSITGSATAPYTGMNGNYALFAGTSISAGTNNAVSLTYIQGVDNTSGMNINSSSGDLVVGQSIGGGDSQGNAIAILDMSGLANLTANIDQVLIGFETSTSSGPPARWSGALYLPKNSTITMNNPGTSANAGLIVGYAGRNGAKANYLYLGQTTVLNVDNVTIAGKRASLGYMMFNTAKWTNPATVLLTMRGITDTSAQKRVANIVVGDAFDTPSGSASDSYGVLDLRGGTADINVTSLILGRTPTTTTSNTSRGGQGTLYLQYGTIDATTFVLGQQNGDWNGAGSSHATAGTANISGGTLSVSNPATNSGAGSFVLAYRSTATGANGLVSGTLNITGGTVQTGCDIVDGGGAPVSPATATSTILLNGGTLDMGLGGLHAIGGAGTAAIDSLTFSSGTLKNVKEINGGAAISKGTSGILTIAGVNTYSGGTTVSAGTLLAEGSLTSFVTVGNSATLGGNGSIGGLNVQAGGTLSTGDSPGKLTVNGNATLSGIDLVEILGTSPGPGPTGYDQLAVTSGGAVSLSGTLTVTSTYSPNATDVFWIIDNTSTGGLSGNFTPSTLPAGWADAGWTVLYNVDCEGNSLAPNSGNDVAIALVPEPSALLMLIMAAGLGLLLKRFRN